MYLHLETTSDFNILSMFIFSKHQRLYVKRKCSDKIEISGKSGKYLNVYRYLDAFKFSKLLIVRLETVDEKTCNGSIV